MPSGAARKGEQASAVVPYGNCTYETLKTICRFRRRGTLEFFDQNPSFHLIEGELAGAKCDQVGALDSHHQRHRILTTGHEWVTRSIVAGRNDQPLVGV